MDNTQGQLSRVPSGQGSASWHSALKGQIDALLQRAADAGDVPGVIAAVTDRTETIYEGAFGQRVLGQGPDMSGDTVVWLASMTKAITATAAMQLVEQGRLALDSPASAIVPEIAAAQVLEGFAPNGQPRIRPPKQPVTLRHLLTHTAGFGYEMWNADTTRYNKARGVPFINTCENAALRMPLLFDPGERWEYGISIDWVGKMVEEVSGKRLGAYLTENLFSPLEMSSTAFKITSNMRGRLAKMHQRDDNNSLRPLMDWEFPQEPEFEMGGGGLYSTAGDYIKWVRMILNRGACHGIRVLRAETVDLMARNNIGKNRVSCLRTVMPSLSNDAEFFPGMPKTWGLSFQINTERAPTGRPAGGLMWAGLCNSYFWIDPVSGVGGVYVTQMFPFADKKSLPLFYAVESSVYEWLP
jgi:CubicO group peptidase (beta-lactamase class C family)